MVRHALLNEMDDRDEELAGFARRACTSPAVFGPSKKPFAARPPSLPLQASPVSPGDLSRDRRLKEGDEPV